MKRWMACMLACLLVLGSVTLGMAESKTLPTLDTFVTLYTLFAPLLEWEGIEEVPEIVDAGEQDLAMVFLEGEGAIIFSFVKGTRDLAEILVLFPTAQSDDAALEGLLFSSILSIQAAGVMTDVNEILVLLQDLGLTDAQSVAAGVRSSKEVDGILVDLLIDSENGILMLSYPE